jgi:glycolate oxidase
MNETRLTEALRRELSAIVGPTQVHAGPAEKLAYSYDGTFQQHLPDVAVTPGNEAEVAEVVRLAARERLPIVPRGAGTSLTGGTIPLTGGLVLSLARLNQIVEIDPVNSLAVVQPGVITGQLQSAVEAIGLFYPPDPASLQQSTIGGNVACNAGGPRCLKYGVTKDYVLGLRAVLADGRLLRCGGKLIKNVTGYQLAQLLVGSEGTLGVITEVTLRLIPRPNVRFTAAALFDRLDDASRAVTAVMMAGVMPVALEMIDQTCLNLVEDFLQIGLPRTAEAMLLLEADGSDQAAVQTDLERIAAVCRTAGAREVQIATTAAERDALWKARRSVSPALGRARPSKLGEDIVVPRSAIPAMVRRVGEIGRQFDLPIPVFGHIGDGNLHPNILFDRRLPGELERVESAATEIFRAAIEFGGTLSGEHGIGTLKREFLEDDLGAVAVDLMAGIKRLLDPHDLLNPGKVFPLQPGSDHSGFLTALPSLEGITPG